MNRKLTFLIGSLIGSTIGLLFARESGKDLRNRLVKAGTPQEKFEVLFQEYMKVGKDAFHAVEDSSVAKDIVKGGKEIVQELKRRADTDGGRALKIAHEKAMELIEEAERRLSPVIETVAKKVKTGTRKAAGKATKAKKEVKAAAPKKAQAVKKAAGVKKTASKKRAK